MNRRRSLEQPIPPLPSQSVERGIETQQEMKKRAEEEYRIAMEQLENSTSYPTSFDDIGEIVSSFPSFTSLHTLPSITEEMEIDQQSYISTQQQLIAQTIRHSEIPIPEFRKIEDEDILLADSDHFQPFPAPQNNDNHQNFPLLKTPQQSTTTTTSTSIMENEWTDDEIELFKELYQLYGRSWNVIHELMFFTKTPVQLFVYWIQSKGFSRKVAKEDGVYNIGTTCFVCFEDETFSGQVRKCDYCEKFAHPSCCSSTSSNPSDKTNRSSTTNSPSCQQLQTNQSVAITTTTTNWYCSKECERKALVSSSNSTNSTITRSDSTSQMKSPSPLLLVPNKSTSATPISDIKLLCAFPHCTTGSKANRFCIIGDDPSDIVPSDTVPSDTTPSTTTTKTVSRDYYGVAASNTSNLRRHVLNYHKYTQISNKPILQELIERGLVKRITCDQLIIVPSPPPKRAADSSSKFNNTNMSTTNTTIDPGAVSDCGSEPELAELTTSFYESNSLPADFCGNGHGSGNNSSFITRLLFPVPAKPKSNQTQNNFNLIRNNQQQQRNSADEVSSIAVASTLSSVLRKFRWGTRCSNCLQSETNFISSSVPNSTTKVSYGRILSMEAYYPQRKDNSHDLTEAVHKTTNEALSNISIIINKFLNPFICGGGFVPLGKSEKCSWVLAVRSDLIDVNATFVPGNEITWPWDMHYRSYVRPGDFVAFWIQVPSNESSSSSSSSSNQQRQEESRIIGSGRILFGPREQNEEGFICSTKKSNSKNIGTGTGASFIQEGKIPRVRVVVLNYFEVPITRSILKSDSKFSKKAFMQIENARTSIAPLTFKQMIRLKALLLKYTSKHNGNNNSNEQQQPMKVAERIIIALDKMMPIEKEFSQQDLEDYEEENISDKEFQIAKKWLINTNHITEKGGGEGNRYQITRGFRSIHHLYLHFQHEKRLLERPNSIIGSCYFCGEIQSSTNSALLHCTGDCGLSCHQECCEKPQWTCEDCLFRSANTTVCFVCKNARTENNVITCNNCDSWYHINCLKKTDKFIQNSNGTVFNDFWLCPCCLVSEYQAARCEIFIGCNEVSLLCVSILRDIAKSLCNQHRGHAKGCAPIDIKNRTKMLANALSKAKQLVKAEAACAISEWTLNIMKKSDEMHQHRIATEPSAPPNVIQYRKKKQKSSSTTTSPSTTKRSKSIGATTSTSSQHEEEITINERKQVISKRHSSETFTRQIDAMEIDQQNDDESDEDEEEDEEDEMDTCTPPTQH